MKLIIFVKKEFNHLMDTMDLTDSGTKVFGDLVIVDCEKEGDPNKLIKEDRIVAAYCNGKIAIQEGIKSLSGGQMFVPVADFKDTCERLLS